MVFRDGYEGVYPANALIAIPDCHWKASDTMDPPEHLSSRS